MANSFRPYSLDQAYLMPQAPSEWLPEGYSALFLEETVSLLDLGAILEKYEGWRGQITFVLRHNGHHTYTGSVTS